MMEHKQTTNYTLTITTDVECPCAHIDPIGLCTPTDCMTCRNARVKIVREDNEIMRDDNVSGINAGYEEKTAYIKNEFKKNPSVFLENILGIRISGLKKYILNSAKKYDVL